MKRIIAALLCAVSLLAQQGSAVNQVSGPTPNNGVYLYFYNGSSQITHICFANAVQPATTYTIGALPGLTSVVVLTNVGTINLATTAYLWVGQRITLAGFALTALNGTYTISAVSGSTATIATSGVADATYTTSGATLATTGPVLNNNVWNIQIFTYASTLLATSYYAGGGIGPNNQLACSSRASY